MKRLNLSQFVAITTLALGIPTAAPAAAVPQEDYAQEVRVADTTLNLLGSGLREKWSLDVHTMGAYSESGSCNARDLVLSDEIKYIRIDLQRDVSAGEMAREFSKAFRDNTPNDAPASLTQQIRTFVAHFGLDRSSGDTIELTYFPGTGTQLRINDKEQGTITPGKAFAELLWSCYFSATTCCPSLKKQILSECSN